MGTTSPLHKLQRWLAGKLGSRYAVVIDTADRTVVAFLTAFAAVWLGGGLDVAHLTDLSVWQKAAAAGLAAALSLLKSVIVASITGDPALASLASRTLRARRDSNTYRPAHHVPLRKPPAGTVRVRTTVAGGGGGGGGTHVPPPTSGSGGGSA
jgi:hypothetical protein